MQEVQKAWNSVSFHNFFLKVVYLHLYVQVGQANSSVLCTFQTLFEIHACFAEGQVIMIEVLSL